MGEQRAPRPEVAAYVKEQVAVSGLQLSEHDLAGLIASADNVAACALGGRMDRDDRKQIRDLIARYGK